MNPSASSRKEIGMKRKDQEKQSAKIADNPSNGNKYSLGATLGSVIVPALLIVSGLAASAVVWGQLGEPAYKSLEGIAVNDLRYIDASSEQRDEVVFDKRTSDIAEKVACVFDERKNSLLSDAVYVEEQPAMAYADIRPPKARCWHDAADHGRR